MLAALHHINSGSVLALKFEARVGITCANALKSSWLLRLFSDYY